MKLKILVTFLAVLVAVPLLSVAAQADDVIGFETVPYIVAGVNSSTNQALSIPLDGNTHELGGFYYPNNGYGDSYLFGLFLPMTKNYGSNYYLVSCSFIINGAGNFFTPVSIIENSGLDDENVLSLNHPSDTRVSAIGSKGTYYFNYKTDSNGQYFNFYGIIRGSPDNIVVRCSRPAYNVSGAIRVYGEPAVVEVQGTSDLDFLNLLTSILSATDSSSTSITSALSSVGSQISQGQTESAVQMTASVEQLQKAVEKLTDGMSDSVTEGLKKYDEEEEEKLVEELDDNVQEILDKLPLVNEQDKIVNATDAIVNAFSDTSMDCNFTFPAGTVSIAGTSYTFWNEYTVDLNVWFQNQHIKLLLVAFRFVIAYAFLMYMLSWINKIISVILLEDVAHESQAWTNDVREGGAKYARKQYINRRR